MSFFDELKRRNVIRVGVAYVIVAWLVMQFSHKLGEKPRRTWQEAAVQWVREKDHKANLNEDKAKLKWMDQFLRGKYLDEIKRALIFEIAEAKKAEASPATSNRYLALIRAILRMARDEWEWLDHIPKVKMYP